MPLQDREDMPKLRDRQGQIPPIQGPCGSTIKGISFDAAGTLIRLVEPVGISYSRVAKSFGILAEPDRLDQAFRTVWKSTPSAFSPECKITDSGEATERDWWSSIVRDVFREAGASYIGEDSYHHFFDALYDHFAAPGTWELIDGARDLVDLISGTLPCLILSNFDERLRDILDHLELRSAFDHIILSSEMRASKPDPEMFKEAQKRLGLASDVILHIGDDPLADWDGARAAGFRIYPIGKGQNSLRNLFGNFCLQIERS